MTVDNIEQLIQKYSDGTAREEEIRQLMNWYRDSLGEIHWSSSDPAEKKKVLLQFSEQEAIAVTSAEKKSM